MTRHLVRDLIGAKRPKVIAVLGATRDDAVAGVAHAHTAGGALPVWAWCGERAEQIPGCDRWVSGAGALRIWLDLQSVWPALSIVSWTGKPGSLGLKLVAFAVPPFRIVAFNETHGFFAARPAGIASHASRRLRDSAVSGCRRLADWVNGGGQWLGSITSRCADKLESFSLAVLAVVAQTTPPLSRWAMKRFEEGQGILHIQPPPATDGNFTEISIPNRGWPRRAVMRGLGNSECQFVVFRQRGEKASAEPLIALALETNAFAVARQTAWSGWRRVVVHKHPFRKLQPGEVTEVAAPWSSLIAIRKDLLLRFGVPRALTCGAALMLLFRQAQAAGLRNLVMGSGEALTDEPAMALEDAELALRLAWNRGLAAPAHPARSRGNLIWSHSHRRGKGGKPRVLVVSPYLPFPLAHGGAVRIYNLCRAMSDRVDFVLACFREVNETVRHPELHEVFCEVYAVDIDETYFDPGVPKQVAEYRNSAMADLISQICADHVVDLVQIEYTQMAEYRNCTGSVPVILVEHDLTFTLHSQLADVLPDTARRPEYELWLSFEREALQRANGVWTMSDRDRTLAVGHGASKRSTVVVPNGVDLQRFQPSARQEAEQRILFVGSFRHLPNLLAFEALCARIMPPVWDACPEAKLHVIAGPNHLSALKRAGKLYLLPDADPRVTLEGFAEDVRPAYRECDVVLIPLPVSAGTNIKLMEAMACGRAVVSTPVGCQGLNLRDGHDLLIREPGPEFASAVVSLLRDEALRQRIGARARVTAESQFDWNAIARVALGSYEFLLRAPVAERMDLQQISI